MIKSGYLFDEKSREISRLLFLLDVLLTLLVLLLVYRTRQYLGLESSTGLAAHVALLPILGVPLGYFLTRFGAYQGLRVVSLAKYAYMVVKAFVISLAVLVGILFFLKVDFVSRSFLIGFSLLSILVMVVVRGGLIWWYFRRSVQKGENYLKVLIIGTGRRAKRLTEMLNLHNEWGIHILGYMDTESEQVGEPVLEGKVLGTVHEIEKILTSQVVDEVILAVPRSSLSFMEEIVSACEEQGVRFRFMADVFDLQVARMQMVEMDGIPLLTFDPVAQNEKMLLIKRLMDLAIVLAAMPLILPLMGLIALAIKIDDGGPILFVQERVGLRKRLFPMLKFRSMVVDAEAKLKEIEHLNEAEGPNFKIAKDPRITKVGHFLRKTSLDELPQLLNVIRGHMSLVGPRPMSQRDVELFDRGIQRKRFSVKPGLTCIWQISGRSNLSFEKWLELDLKYIDEWNLWMDFKILFLTIPVVLKGSGAV
ncbi:MAG: sugar transferase [Candidatus Thiodiazotropha sp. (ex Monitilora ramsayi)]|nr:sugar transferase [Candidatus Thiodiazotropha sp. (ex Monitilora ramsayi)]